MPLELQIFLALTGIALATVVLLAPLESLTWWSGWFGETEDLPEIAEDVTESQMTQVLAAQPRAYIVYLTGIGGFADKTFLPREQRFLDRLQERQPHIEVVDDIYPYSVTNTGLISDRRLSRFWRWAVHQKEKGSPIGFLINLRNVMQVLVAADSRYGLIYARGIAEVIVRALGQHGYFFGSGVPVILIGYSGGGEMALSAVAPLKETINAPVTLISLGGVMGNDPNILVVDHLYHLFGDRDRTQLLGPVLFPGRWRLAIGSDWNQARRDGRITLQRMGPMKHNGPQGYLAEDSHLPDGQTYLDYTLGVISEIIERDLTPEGLADRRPQTEEVP